MKMKKLILAGILLAAAPVGMLAAQNWNTTFAASVAGHRVGNPEAETQLITFVSYSCPHCANFELEADASLRTQYIHSGKLSLEVRHVIRNVVDLAAAMSTECGKPEQFFQRHRSMMLSHDIWMKVATDASAAQQQRWNNGTLPSRIKAVASDLGFYDRMEQRGLSVTAIDQCLNNEGRALEIIASGEADDALYGIPGTPSFALNGQLLPGIHGWAGLRSAINASLTADKTADSSE